MYLNGTKCVALALSCCLSLSAIAKNAIPVKGQGLQKPLSFIENNGQMTAANGKPQKDIQFMMSTAGMNLYVGNGQLHYQFRKPDNSNPDAPKIKTYRMDVTLLGANPAAKVEASDMQEYFETYYTSPSSVDGITAHTYNRVTYKEVYPGIDWVLYVKGDKVEYDFVVRPGADASLIKMQYGGATKLSITADGGIAAVTPMGKIQEKKPYAYEAGTGKEVAANFRLHNNVVSFEAAKCNGTLTIDPVVLWSTYFGGTNEDVATCVRATNTDIYVGGYTSSGSLSLGGGIHDPSFSAVYDAFVTRYNIAGVRQFTTYFGSVGNDRGTCLTMDNTGAIYLGGFTTSTSPALATVYHLANNGLADGFIFKLTNVGARTWSTYYGGTGNDYIYGIACDATNSVYVTGRTESATSISTAGVFQTALSGAADAFIAKFSAAGANTFSTYYGGTGVDEASGITCDGLNNVIITGQTNSVVNIATAGAHQLALSGANDAFVAKLNTTGTTRAWGTYFGGSGAEQGTEIVCNTITGAVGFIGYTTSTSGIASASAHQQVYGGGAQDVFVASLSTTGARLWSTYYGGSDVDYGESICLDPQRNFVIGGGTFSTTGIASTISFQPAIGGNYDAFAAKFNTLGQRMWGTYFGNALYDYGFGVACNGNGQIVLAGHTTSTTGISTVGSSQAAYAGGTYDGFVTLFRTDTFALINQPFTDTLVCVGGQLSVSYSVNTLFRPGNVFTIQLSNASGSFATPTFVGSVTATTSGAITGTIPGAPLPVAPGTGYRIRLLSTSPAYISPDNFVNIRVVSALPATTVTANTPVCVGNTLNLSATGTWSISSYFWNGPAGFFDFSSNPSIPSVTLANGGVYTVTTTHNGCPNNVNTVNVVVNDVFPAAPVATASALNCNGGTLNLFADAGFPATGGYTWSGPSAFTSTDQNPTLAPLAAVNAGTYSVTTTVAGCESLPGVVSVAVTPNSIVSVNIGVTPNDTICGGDTVSFTAFAVNGGVSPTFQWMNGASPVVGAMSSTWLSSTLIDGAAISCILTSNAVCPLPANATSNIIKMNVITNEPSVLIFASPGLSVPTGDSITFTSVVYNVGVGPTYQWQRNGANIAGATNSTYKLYNVTKFDTITVVVTSTMACATSNFAKSNALIGHPNTAVAEVSALFDNIELFPNPNAGSFSIKGDLEGTGTNEVSVAVMNPLGQMIYNEHVMLQNGMLNKTISIDRLASGVYLMQLSAEGRSKIIRFTVQR